MFIPTLQTQTTDEQKKLFLEPALKHEIIGCYAQTEVRVNKQRFAYGIYNSYSLVTGLTFRGLKLLPLISLKHKNSNFIPLHSLLQNGGLVDLVRLLLMQLSWPA